MPFSKLKAYLRKAAERKKFLACVVESEYSRAISPHAKPRIDFRHAGCVREIDREFVGLSSESIEHLPISIGELFAMHFQKIVNSRRFR